MLATLASGIFMMQVMIREQDRRAMDLIMDRSPTAASKTEGKSIYAAADIGIRHRVGKIEKVLGLLDNLAAADPPANMLKRTLRLIEESSGRPVSAGERGASSHLFNPPPPFA